MSRPSDGSTTSSSHATFELERFTWGGPDRLALAGRFVGLAGATDGEPVLALRGPAGTQRLVAVPGSVSGSPDGGGRWRAEFAWQEAPTAFEAAELRFGDDFVVALPDPSARRRPFGRQVLEVRDANEPEPAAGEAEVVPAPAAEEAAAVPVTAEHVRLRAELVVAQEETRGLRAELDRAGEELAATHAALDAERERHAEDAGRFRRELTEVGASAEQAVVADRAAAQRLEERVAELEGAAAEADKLRARVAELEGTAAEAETLRARVAELEGTAAEADTLRGRVAELEGTAADADTLRGRVAELETAAEEARALRSEHDRTREAVDEARTSLEALLHRLPARAPSEAADEPPSQDG